MITINSNQKLNQNILFYTSLMQHNTLINTDCLKDDTPVFYLQGAVHHADDVVKLLVV